MAKSFLRSPKRRLNRIKHYGGFPALAVQACLDAVGAKISDVEHVAVGQDSDANLAKKVQYALANPAKILNFIRLRQRKEAMRDVRSLLSNAFEVDPGKLRFQEHHLEHHIAHIASAYYCSPWEKAAGFSYDGSGDFVSTMMARCEGNDIEVLDRVFLPHSLGSFYTMICEFIGYKKYGDEGKVMGLAPYGKDTYCEQVRKIVGLKNGIVSTRPGIFQAAGQQSGHGSAAGRHGAPGAAFLRAHGENCSANRASRMPKSRSATWTLRLPCSIASKKSFFHLLNELAQACSAGESGDGGRVRAEQRGQRKTLFDARRFGAPGFSLRPAMKGWRSARRCTPIIRC